MARQVLGALTTLNLSTNLDPMFLELYTAAGGNFTAVNSMALGNGSNTGVRIFQINAASGATDGSQLGFQRAGSNVLLIGDAGGVLGGASGGTVADSVFLSTGTANMRFWTNGTERMRIEPGGNVGIGGTPTSAQAKLSVITPSGTSPSLWLVQSGWRSWSLGIGANPADPTFIVRDESASLDRLRIESTGVVRPGGDNTQPLGAASFRWSTVYAATGTINTSDAREKTPVRDIETAELDCAIALSKEVGSFRFLSAIKDKGDGARLHIGMTVQRAMEVMESFGLDPLRYAFICHDAWDEVNTPEEKDADGKVTQEATTTPAGDRYGFRADELALFIMRGLAARLDALEA